MMSCIGRDRECVGIPGKPRAPGNGLDAPPLFVSDNASDDAAPRSLALRTGAVSGHPSRESTSPEPPSPLPPSQYARQPIADQSQISPIVVGGNFTPLTPSLTNEVGLLSARNSKMEQRLNILEERMIHHQVTVDAASQMMIQHQQALEDLRQQLTLSDVSRVPDEFDAGNRQHASRMLERSMMVADSRLLALEQRVATLVAKPEVPSLEAKDLVALQSPVVEKLRSLEEDLRRITSSREVAQSAEKINLMEQEINWLKIQQPQYQQLQVDLKALLDNARDNDNAKRISSLEDLARKVSSRPDIQTAKPSTNTPVSIEETPRRTKSPEEIMMERMIDLSGKMLDKAVMYQGNESVWDMAFFIGLPYLGPGVSVMAAVMYAMNVALQVWFCVIIWSFMLESPADSNTMDGLLRFRGSVAHDVEYADRVQHRSMLEQICSSDEKLIFAGRQFTINDDMSGFQDSALPLSILTILCWMICALGEASETMHFLTAIWSLHHAEMTTIMTDDDSVARHGRQSEFSGTWMSQHISEPDDAQAALIRVGVVVRVTGVSRHRQILGSLCIGVPRFLIALILGYIGIRYLAITSKMEDLLLNGMALGFIVDLDELIYKFFMPRRAKTLMDNLEPLPAGKTPWRRLKVPWLMSLLKLVVVLVGVFIVKLVKLDPFFEMLVQATDILCSGNKDFVVALSRATGLLHAAATQEDDNSLEMDEVKNVFELAKPVLKNHSGLWEFDGSLLDVSTVSDTVLMPRQTDSLDGAAMVVSAYSFVQSLKDMSVADSDYLSCVDDSAGQNFNATVRRLRKLLQNSSIRGCQLDSAFIQTRCGWMNMTSLRAICPQICGCNATLPRYAGYFAHPKWGCPNSCQVITAVYEQAEYLTSSEPRACVDTRPPVFFLRTPFASTGQFDVMWDWYSMYIRTTINYYLTTEGYGPKVEINVKKAACELDVMSCSLAANFTAHVLSGAIIDTLLSGTWEFMPGVKHTRSAEGCDFLTSYELTFMLNINFCASESGASLRAACPVACGCGTDIGCPVACAAGRGIVPPCADMVDVHFAEARTTALQWLTGTNVTQCNHAQLQLWTICGQRGSHGRYARELCPETCGCNEAFSPVVGFFGGPNFGCAAACGDVMNSWIALQQQQHPHTSACIDISAAMMLNFSNLNNAFDNWAIGLSDWLADQGTTKSTELRQNLLHMAFGKMISVPGLRVQDVDTHVQYIMNGNLKDTILSGSWELLPGVPHPRNKTGCAYMASYEFSLMLGIDVCGIDQFSSLRYPCPISCRCDSGMAQCPPSC